MCIFEQFLLLCGLHSQIRDNDICEESGIILRLDLFYHVRMNIYVGGFTIPLKCLHNEASQCLSFLLIHYDVKDRLGFSENDILIVEQLQNMMTGFPLNEHLQ